MLAELGGVPQDDHDVDVAQRLGLGVPPVGAGEEVGDDVEGLIELAAQLLLAAAGGGVFGVGGLQAAAEFRNASLDGDHVPLRL